MNKKFSDPALDLDNIVPKNSSWDIERSLAGKLELLEQRTQRAILRMAQKKAREEHNIARGPAPEELSSEGEG